MRYKDLTENIENLNDILDKIKTECSDICKYYYSGKYFYRGVRKKEMVDQQDVFIGKPRENREPLSTSPDEHAFCNKGLSLLGYVVNRSNSIAISPSMEIAKSYGTPYMIFPKNGFHYSFSRYSDMIHMVVSRNFIRDYIRENFPEEYNSFLKYQSHNDLMNILLYKNDYDYIIKDYWCKVFNKSSYIEDNYLDQAIKWNSEIMISGSEYYAINYKYFNEVYNFFGDV